MDVKEVHGEYVEESKHSENFEFKKPIFVGKLGKVPKKLSNINKTVSREESKESTKIAPVQNKETSAAPDQQIKTEVPYKEPSWSGLPPFDSGYRLEVLKSGVILESIDLTKQPYYVFGRFVVDITMAHPTISRYHAVMQYKSKEESGDGHPIGWYLYDLGSSHGTFLNKKRIQPKHYVRVQVGHLVKLGCSTRYFILQGPDEDIEEESELSLTEMKQLKLAKRIELEREKELFAIKMEEKRKKEEEAGISWGMAEDAEEETDLTDNPYATTTNEDLYLDDPKKTLRGYFEREGIPLEYNCEEKGIGQFLCRVELPIEDSSGRPIIAEVIHKGKKKDAVVQCALEACRIIDRHGLLRQAKHESHKKKEKNWEEIDFYDSDEDTFLDRTGTIEKKRQGRIQKYKDDKTDKKMAHSEKTFTYEELVGRCTEISTSINELNIRLDLLRTKEKKELADDGEEDELDKFMKGLNKQSIADKAEISKIKLQIRDLQQELAKMQRLAEIAKPVEIPPLIKATQSTETAKPILKKTSTSVIIGKRIKLKNRVQTPFKQSNSGEKCTQNNSDEEVDSDDEGEKRIKLESPEVEKLDPNIKNKDDTFEKNTKPNVKDVEKSKVIEKVGQNKVYGPMRPPEGYVVPENYFEQASDRDVPEITDQDGY